MGPEIPELRCVPLYSALPPAQQQKIFEPAPGPRDAGGPAGRKYAYLACSIIYASQ